MIYPPFALLDFSELLRRVVAGSGRNHDFAHRPLMADSIRSALAPQSCHSELHEAIEYMAAQTADQPTTTMPATFCFGALSRR